MCCATKNKKFDIKSTGPDVSKRGRDGDGWNVKEWHRRGRDEHDRIIPPKQVWRGSSININADTERCPKGYAEVGRYHSHPSDSSEFSPGDLTGSGRDLPFGVGTPSGEVSLVEPVHGTFETGYGKTTGLIEWRGYSFGPNGFQPAPVLPLPGGGFGAVRPAR